MTDSTATATPPTDIHPRLQPAHKFMCESKIWIPESDGMYQREGSTSPIRLHLFINAIDVGGLYWCFVDSTKNVYTTPVRMPNDPDCSSLIAQYYTICSLFDFFCPETETTPTQP